MPVHSIGIEFLIPVTRNITNGTNGYFSSFTKKVWLIEKILRSTGAQVVRRF